MGIRYKIYPIKDNINHTPKTGLIVKTVSRGRLQLSDMAKKISHSSSFSEADVVGLTTALVYQIKEELLQGFNVSIDGLGTFSVSAEARMIQEEKEIRATSVQVKKVAYRASAELMEKMQHACFEKANS